jgi:drug/metabolite transporter (DMT)-like permease
LNHSTDIRRPTTFDVLRLLFIGIIWGASFIFIAIALEHYGPISIAAWRVCLAAIVLLVICLFWRQTFPKDLRSWLIIFTIGLLNSALPFYLISFGQQTISSAESALMMAGGTFCTLIVSHFVSQDERINFYRALGVAVGFSGVVLLLFWDLMDSGFGGLTGQTAVLAAGCSYSISSILARKLSHHPPISIATGAMTSASLYMVPLAFLFENPFPQMASNQSVVAIFYLGVVATALGIVIRFVIIKANGAVFVSQVGYLVPLFGVIWSWVYFSDVIQLQTWISLGLILVGIGISRRGT